MGSGPEEEDQEMRPLDFKVVPAGRGKTLNVLGDEVVVVVGGADTAGAYAVVEQVSQPGSGPPLHMHLREDEGFYILEGEYEFRVGDEVVRAMPGTFLIAPRRTPHTFQCVGTRPGRVQVIITPAGFENFFGDLSALSAAGPPDTEEVLGLARKYELEILGSPPGA